MDSIVAFFRWLYRQPGGPRAFIVSYPKTGRTWLCVLLGKALCEHGRLSEKRLMNTEYVTAAAGLLKTRFTHDGAAMSKRRSFQELNPDKGFYRGRKVLLLARDVRDTLVSAYFQATKRIHVFEGTISDFVRDERYGIRKILTFYQHWHNQRQVPGDCLFLRYEDLHRDTADTLGRTLQFLGAEPVDRGILNRAVEFAAFDNLKKLEAANRFQSSRLAGKDPADPESAKVRKGRVGGYGDYLSSDDLAYIEEHLRLEGCPFTQYEGRSV